MGIPSDFRCGYAARPGEKCIMCDCFVDQYPDDPFGLHPEAFVALGVTND
ncbi:MAG: hypothetical protein HZY75_13220 [Nocardioidaceae bacterium]|nr:MAG: hypothetical protein HZY75_13220 [Nocardioidaceae bacterium]